MMQKVTAHLPPGVTHCLATGSLKSTKKSKTILRPPRAFVKLGRYSYLPIIQLVRSFREACNIVQESYRKVELGALNLATVEDGSFIIGYYSDVVMFNTGISPVHDCILDEKD